MECTKKRPRPTALLVLYHFSRYVVDKRAIQSPSLFIQKQLKNSVATVPPTIAPATKQITLSAIFSPLCP